LMHTSERPASKVPKLEGAASSSASTATSSSAVGPSSTPHPIASSGGTVNYLSEEEKARLFAKYGQIQPPKPSEVAEVAGAGCKQQ